jgi:hypothetical protein
VACAGDVNGDGYADLVVGASGADPGGRSGAGTASVFHGSATWTQPPAGTARTPDRLLEGGASGDRFGDSVASAGDVNGDGSRAPAAPYARLSRWAAVAPASRRS